MICDAANLYQTSDLLSAVSIQCIVERSSSSLLSLLSVSAVVKDTSSLSSYEMSSASSYTLSQKKVSMPAIPHDTTLQPSSNSKELAFIYFYYSYTSHLDMSCERNMISLTHSASPSPAANIYLSTIMRDDDNM
jgi:hypothetical protein